jgi:carotenoid cleavage dioxygenase
MSSPVVQNFVAGTYQAANEIPIGQDLSRPSQGPGSGGQFSPIRAEVTIDDCVIEGRIPADLNGGFYATGPDPQYPMAPGNILFDGEGHVRMFRIRNGRVDYRTRYARTERWMAQDKARRVLMPMYRNPSRDDPSVRGLSRSTANTHVLNHKGLLLALKEDSPPCALDLNTLFFDELSTVGRTA